MELEGAVSVLFPPLFPECEGHIDKHLVEKN